MNGGFKRRFCLDISLIWQHATPTGVLPAQLIHQMFQMGRQFGVNRAKVLLQPFAHGVAYRSAGLAIDLFAGIGDSAIHSEFRFVVMIVMTSDQFIAV
jgi:hypothetical protein